MKIKCLYHELLPLDKIIPHPANRNKHPEKQICALAKIIAKNGQRSPIVISNLSGKVVKGHGRLEAIKLLGWEKAAVEYQDYENELEELNDRIADNEIARYAEFDSEGFKLDLVELDLDPAEIDLEEYGLIDFSFEKEVDKSKEEIEDDIPKVDEKECVICEGMLIELGNHRLLCGDCTVKENVELLMGGEKADMVFTDPPYNIAYKGGSKLRKEIKNDSIGKDFYQFLCNVFQNLNDYTKGGACVYVSHADSERVSFTKSFVECDFHLSSVIIWKKNNSTFGRQDYFWKHEPILYGWNNSGPHKWYGPNNEDTVWEIDRPSRSEEHPTMKPIMLIERAINNSSMYTNIVLDLFLGSGSTLIACEKTNRKCYGMEIDPHYCQVIIERYIKYVGSDEKVFVINNGKRIHYSEL